MLHRVFIAASALVSCLACQSEKDENKGQDSVSSEVTEAVSTGPVLDNKIAEAVANAAEGQPAGAAEASKGPPPDGILGAARADAESKVGSAPKVVMGSSGSEPRVTLTSTLPTQPRSGTSELSLRTGASMLPTTELRYETVFGSGADETAASRFTLKVVGADLAANQSARIPEEMAQELRKLKGSTFRFPAGDVLTGTPSFELAKGANSELETLMQAAAAALTEAIPVLPAEPVGAGAFWMTTSRESLLGADVVAYRMTKLSELEGDRAVLEVTTKRYLAAGGIGLPGIEQAPVRQFQAESTTQMTVVSKERLPIDGQSQTSLRALVERNGEPLPVQVEMRSLFAFPPTAAGSPRTTTD